jgi:hypothetical protein
MFFVVGTYYNGFYTGLNSEAYRAQLGQAADYIASNIVELVTLSHLVEDDMFLIKTLEIPTFIGERLYNISLIQMAEKEGGQEYVSIYLFIEKLHIGASSDLPWAINQNIQRYVNQSIQHPVNLNISNHLLSDAGVSRTIVSDSPAAVVVWCSKVDDVIVFGLGVEEDL